MKLLLDWEVKQASLLQISTKWLRIFKYVHSISSRGLCWAVKGKRGTFNNSLQELWEQSDLSQIYIQEEFDTMRDLRSRHRKIFLRIKIT